MWLYEGGVIRREKKYNYGRSGCQGDIGRDIYRRWRGLLVVCLAGEYRLALDRNQRSCAFRPIPNV